VAASEPIDPRVRLAIAQWPEDAPRGAVSTFCAEHGISRKSFYELRKRAKTEGPAAVLEPKSRRPHSSPSELTEEVKAQAVQVRAALESSGLDHGPISVHDKMHTRGLDVVPSIASLARIFREAGLGQALDLAAPFATAVGVAVDTFHVWWDPSLPAAIGRAGREGRLASYQVCDWLQPIAADPLLSRGMMGDGLIDFAPITAAVTAAGYAGDVEVEIFNADVWASDPDEVVARMVERYREVIEPGL